MARLVVCWAWVALACAGAVLEGTVVESRTGRPLARAQVGLQMAVGSGFNAAAHSVVADAAGRFRFDNLPPGAYGVTAQRAGYAATAYGQRRATGLGSPIVLGADASFSCELKLKRAGAISGEVWDENQIGLAGAAVIAYRAGEQPLRSAGTATTDDRGAYRISGLAPGRYYVRTAAIQLPDNTGMLPTFFGQTLSAADARTVDADLDAESGGINIQPVAGRLGRISGRAIGPASVTVMLFSDTVRKDVSLGPRGDFAFDQLAPGDYELVAMSVGGTPMAAYQRVSVREGNNPVTLDVAPWPLINVRVESSGGAQIDPERVLVRVNRKGLSRELPSMPLQGGSTGALLPGEYSIWAAAPFDYYVQSVRGGGSGSDLFVLPRQTIELVVTVSGRPGTIKGTVKTRDGQPSASAPVFLRATDPDLRARLGGARTVRADASGAYRFTGLPPGQYQVFSSFEFAEPGEADWASVPVSAATVEEKSEVTVNLQVAGGM